MDAKTLVEKLSLGPLSAEGGWFRETYRNGELSTAIYYLLGPGEVSRIHKLSSDEIWHFYSGDPVELFLFKDGGCERIMLGGDIEKGHSPQAVVPAGVWQGARLTKEGRFALMGTTVSPAFDLSGFVAADRGAMIGSFPEHREIIEILTKP